MPPLHLPSEAGGALEVVKPQALHIGFARVLVEFDSRFLARRRALPSLSGRTLLFLVLSGLATGTSWLFYFHALKIGPASRVAPLDKLSAPFAVVLAAPVLHEAMTWKIVLGVVFILCGALC